VKDLAGIDHPFQPRGMLGRALHWHQQRKQALAALRTRVFLQGLAEQQMLRSSRRRKPRVGRQKREWCPSSSGFRQLK
jgi:hypothetical protein